LYAQRRPAFFACQNGHLDTVKLLHEWGADFETATRDDGQTPVFTASNQGRFEVVRFLARHCGCSLDTAATDDGATPMYAAALQGHVRLVKFLAEEGAQVDIPLTTDATSPVFVASFEGHTDVVRILCEHGVDVNRKRTSDGIVPLAGACLHGHLETAQILTAFGATVNAVDNHGYTLAQIAEELAPRPVFLQWLAALQENGVCNGMEACAINRMPDVARWLLTTSKGKGKGKCKGQGKGDAGKSGRSKGEMEMPSQAEVDCTGVRSLLENECKSPSRLVKLAGLKDPWPGAPDGEATRRLMKQCLRWWPTSHSLFTKEFQTVVYTVLLSAERLARVVEKIEQKEEEHSGGSGASSSSGSTGTAEEALPLSPPPVMPPEMWLGVLSFVERSWWISIG